MNMMRGGNRQMRRMMDKMGLDMEEIPNVQEVIIKTDKKEIIIPKPSVTEMKSKENSIFQVIAESFEEKELEVPIFSEDDIMLVCQQANCDEEKAKDALAETKGDIAQAILRLTSGKMTQPVWTLTDKEKIKKTLELIEDFENSGSSKHYKANAQKMRIMLDAIKKTLEK